MKTRKFTAFYYDLKAAAFQAIRHHVQQERHETARKYLISFRAFHRSYMRTLIITTW